MDPKPAYPVEKTYEALLHRELSVSWLVLATLLGGRHRLDPCLLAKGFHYLEFGCGQGLNLLFNAAAYPRASFFGVDLNPTHIAQATARAEALGLSNVQFALADLTTFADGLPATGPCRAWPEAYDFVVCHGVASWVGAEVRTALVAAGGALLRPGGIFYCSYNTYPGWLRRSTLQMLSEEESLRAGGSTTLAGIHRSTDLLHKLTGSDTEPWPLGRELPGLRQDMKGLQTSSESYLVAEFQAAHQPLYVGHMHRLCAAHGLSHIGSATLPEMFPGLLDPGRRALVLGAVDPAMREVLLDLAIVQSFRRDLFARGPCPQTPVWRRDALSGLGLTSCIPAGEYPNEFDIALGCFNLDPAFTAQVSSALGSGVRTLGALIGELSTDLEELLSQLSLLIYDGAVGVSVPAAASADEAGSAIDTFNQRCLDLLTAGEEIGGLLSPALLHPFTVTLLEAFFLQVADTDLPPEDVVQLVWMGISMAGGSVKDKQGQPIEDPHQALSHLQEFWETFAHERLPVLRRLGIASPSA